MRRFLPVALAALTISALAGPTLAAVQVNEPYVGQTGVINRPPMDLGADQVGAIRMAGEDMLYPPHRINTWFDTGVAYPIGNLQDRNIDPGLLLRFNQVFWRSENDVLDAYGSMGAMFGNDSYFNDQQNAIAAAQPPAPAGSPYTGVDIQSRYFWMVPATVNLGVKLPIADAIAPFIAVGPGVVWTHESLITSAVNNGAGGTTNVGGDLDPLEIGPGGEQYISPYAIRTQSKFNLGWDARGGIGFKAGHGERPLWIRGVVSASTYYVHTAPSTNLGFSLSFGR